MNFLAHAYLSFEIPEILTGNLITDFMRGHKKDEYPIGIQDGIALHHEIDVFTDQHTTTLNAKEILRPASGRYCGVFMDVIYDHFLATDPTYFPNNQLASFSQNVYKTLTEYSNYFPDRFQQIFYYMEKENWLYHYRTTKGIGNSFGGVYRRAKYLDRSDAVFKTFLRYYDDFQKAYDDFMPEMIVQAENFLTNKGY